MIGRLIFPGILMVVTALAATPAMAQNFKLPSLIPFRKQSTEIKPFHLTDQAKGKPGSMSGASFRNLLNPGKGSNPLADFNQKSRAFFSKTGESISRFAEDTRDTLKNIESPGWNFHDSRPWWSQKKTTDPEMLRREIGQIPRLFQPRHPQAPTPPPRTAQDLDNGQPRHRF